MAGPDARSRGPFAVGMMALHDRDFFSALLANPRGAMTAMVTQGKLTLTAADIDRVVRLIESSQRPLPPDQGLSIWDRWQRTGEIGEIDWPIRCWPEY